MHAARVSSIAPSRTSPRARAPAGRTVSVPSSSRSPARTPSPRAAMSTSARAVPSVEFHAADAVIWDVDGTLADSTELGFTSTNAVLTEANLPAITLAQYMVGTRYATPQRLAWHATGDVDHPSGVELGAAFDRHYIALVSPPDRRILPRRRGPRRRARRRPEQVPGGAQQRLRRVRQGGDGRQRRRQTHDARARRGRRPESQTRTGRSVGAVRGDGMATRAVCLRGRLPVGRRAARAAGMRSVGCLWGAHDRVACEGSFDALVETVDELAALLLGQGAR